VIEAALIRRKAIAKGEVGLFGVDQSSEQDLARLQMDSYVWAELRNPRNLKLIRLLWALATKLADGGLYLDKDDAMDDLKIRAKWAKFIYENNRVVIVPKSLTKASGASLSRLADRMFYIVCTELISHMREGEFREEVEAMVAGKPRGEVLPPAGVGSPGRNAAKRTTGHAKGKGGIIGSFV
jgi:hypothetical protein